MEGSVRKVGSHRWRLVFDGKPHADGRRRQVTRTVNARTKADALDQLRALMVEMGKTEPTEQRTVADLVARWMRHTESDLAARTLEDRHRTWRLHVEPAIGHLDAGDLSPAHLNDLYADLRARRYKAATVIKVHALVSGAYRFAVEEGWVAANPAARARRPKQPKTAVRIPDLGAVAATLLEADLRWPEFGVLVRLLARTGLRRGEVCALRWSDVDLATGVIHVHRALAAISGQLVEKSTKTDEPRRLAIGPDTVAMLRRHRTAVATKRLELGASVTGDTYVFPWTLGGDHPMHPSTVTHRWMACRDAAGAPTVRLHDLRHHTASQLIAAGTDLRTVMERHGWTSLATAQRYIHVVEAKDRAAADVLERLDGS
jgi:integrase